MALNSTNLCNDVRALLKKIELRQVLVTFGFIRELEIETIPDSIINFCVIYAWLRVNEWYKGVENDHTISESKLQVTLLKSLRDIAWSSVFANPVISKGKHQWKVKVLTSKTKYIYLGIASNTDCLDDTGNHYFFGSESATSTDGYSYCMVHSEGASRKLDHTMHCSDNFYDNDGNPFIFKQGEMVSIHLDLDEKTVGISKNDEEVVITFQNIEPSSYRFVFTASTGQEHILELCE